mgnify:CR=1 FL=1
MHGDGLGMPVGVADEELFYSPTSGLPPAGGANGSAARGGTPHKGVAAGVPRQGGSEAARRVDALEAGDYDATGLEEVDLAERFTQSLLEDASGGY